jgi:choline-sulfatase
MGDRPNFLFIMTDQLNPRFLSPYGSQWVSTPNLQCLAEQGAVFENFYCNSPLCVPSRASMLTGRLITDIDVFDNGAELAASIPTFVHHLRREGYRTILSGKMHFVGPDQMHGFEIRATTDIYPATFAWTADWRQGLRYGPEERIFGLVEWSDQLDYDTEVHFEALKMIRTLGRERSRRPFFLCVSYTHPHDPFVITKPYWDLYEGIDVPPPSVSAIDTDALHPFNRWIQHRHGIVANPPSQEEINLARRAYAGMVSYVDDNIGELLREMTRWGLLENTIVIFTSDHGEMLGEHGMWYKRTFMEDAIRVPFIIAWPGVWPKGRRVIAPASLLDVFSTLLQVAEVSELDEVLAETEGASLVPEIEGRKGPTRKIICEYCGEGVMHPAWAMRQGDFKYVYVRESPSLLFNLRDDPFEQVNLAGQAIYADLERDFEREIPIHWKDGSLERRILTSQRNRHWIKAAMREGQRVKWDYQPYVDASLQYVRDY